MEKQYEKLNGKQKDFLNKFSNERYHWLISNIAETILKTGNYPEKLLNNYEKKIIGNSVKQKFFGKVHYFHLKEAKSLLKDYKYFNEVRLSKVTEYAFNINVALGDAFVEWVMGSFRPFEGPSHPFDWNDHFTEDFFNLLEDLK
jgi:hypothetical protein